MKPARVLYILFITCIISRIWNHFRTFESLDSLAFSIFVFVSDTLRSLWVFLGGWGVGRGIVVAIDFVNSYSYSYSYSYS